MKKESVQLIVLAALLIIALIASSIFGFFEKKEVIEVDNVPEKVMQIYSGTVACADCSGIQMEISFVRVTKSDEISGEYSLQEFYIGKSQKPIMTTGKWQAQTNSFGKTKITINSDKPKSEQRYFLLEPESILVLDLEGEVIDSKLNYRLNRL